MTTSPPVDEFAAAFAELNPPSGPKTGDLPVDPPVAADPPAEPPAAEPPAADPPVAADPPAEPPAADPPVAADPPAEPPAADPPVAADPPAEPPAVPPAPAPAPAPVAETEEQIRARIRAEVEAELAKTPPPAPAPAAEPPAEEPPRKVYSDAETASLTKYREEWPDIAAGEKLARREDMHQVVEYVFAQLRPIISDLQAAAARTTKRTQYDDLLDLVPDYDDVRDKTIAWIDTQPSYLKDAYRKVADEGSPDEIADLIGRWKRETGYQSAAPAPAAAPAAPAPAAAAPAPTIPPAAAAAAAALAPVAAGRSEPKGEPDKNDFDSAFAEFAGQK